MSRLKMVVATNPARLLARAAHGLFPLPAATREMPWPTLRSWVVLRQGGLRDDFHALAARENVPGWFDPPVCLFGELAAQWGVPSAPPLGDADRLALLTEILARHGSGVFDKRGHRDRWVPAIDRMVRELAGEGIAPGAFHEALSQKSGRDAFEIARDNALAGIYGDWCDTLAGLGRADGRDGLVRLAQSIDSDPDGFAERLGYRRDIRIVGLADLRGGWGPLLRALNASPAVDTVTLFTSYALPLPADLHVHPDIDADDNARELADTLFRPASPDASTTPATIAAAPSVGLVELPDVAREIEHIAVRVRALIDNGAKPSRIAVVFRNARPGVDAMTSALATLGVPTTSRGRTALAETGPARAIRSLLNAAIHGWTRASLLEVAEHPFLSLGFNANVLDVAARLQVVASLDDWETALAALHERCRARDEREALGKRLAHRERIAIPDTAVVESTRAAWTAWLPHARTLDTLHDTTAWFAWTNTVLTAPAWGVQHALERPPANDFRTWRADKRAAEELVRLMQEWQRAIAEFGANGHAISAESFADRLSVLMSADLITQPETGFGVVVSEALAVGWRSFDHLFIAGLSAGEFPLRLPPSAVFPDDDRRALHDAGLAIDAPEAWRTREEELFRVLCAAPTASLTLSWPAMDVEGREVVRSAYADEVVDALVAQLRSGDADADAAVDEDMLEANGTLVRVHTHHMLTPGFPTLPRHATNDARDHAIRVADTESRRTCEPDAHNGLIEDDALHAMLADTYGESYVWSATQLEGLAKCQWSWFAERVLKLDERIEASEQIEPSAIGSILHDALDRFYDMARKHKNVGAVYLTAGDSAWVPPMAEQALDEAWSTQAAEQWLGLPAFHTIVRTELLEVILGYLAFEISFHEKSSNNSTNSSKQIQMGAEKGEFGFDRVMLHGHGVNFQLRGIVDRVDRGTDTRIEGAERYVAAIDYKTTVYSTPGGGKKGAWNDGVVLQVPLYAAVLREQFPDDLLARLEYRTLRKPEVAHQLQFYGVANKKGQPSSLVENHDAETQMQKALDAAGLRVIAARTGVLPAKPVPSCGCSPYCPARDACRIPGGPVEADGR